jgi:hypothetical protein
MTTDFVSWNKERQEKKKENMKLVSFTGGNRGGGGRGKGGKG